MAECPLDARRTLMPDDLRDIAENFITKHSVLAPAFKLAEWGNEIQRGYQRVKKALTPATKTPARARPMDIHLASPRSAKGRR